MLADGTPCHARRCRWLSLMVQSKGPAIDTAFSVFKRRREIKQDMTQSGAVSVMDRIKLAKSKAESTKEALNARANQVHVLHLLPSSRHTQ
jgi:hypothetical protein